MIEVIAANYFFGHCIATDLCLASPLLLTGSWSSRQPSPGSQILLLSK
jgi:hypothetical protein